MKSTFRSPGPSACPHASWPDEVATPRATKKTRITRVAIATATSSRGRMGWYLDGWARSAKTGLLAPLQPSRGGYMACVQGPLGTCYLYQGEDLDFLQGARLRVQTGKKLGHHTGRLTLGAVIAPNWSSVNLSGPHPIVPPRFRVLAGNINGMV